MAFKFALLAALCVAQAFAFPPSSELREGEPARAIADRDFGIFMGCFNQQWHNVDRMRENIAKVANNVIEGVDDDIREAVAEHLKKTEKPVARIAVALMETHRNMYISLNRLNVRKAYEALISGVHTIKGIVAEIGDALNEVKEENPELTDAMDLYMKSLNHDMEVMVPKIRKDFGECLFTARVNVD